MLLSLALLAVLRGGVDFARDVQPIFEERCHQCHAGEKAKSGFRLDARKRAFRGGNSGEKAIAPGLPAESRLLELVKVAKGEDDKLVMPPRGERLSPAQIATLEAWIEQGAPWPDELSGDELVVEHWAFVRPEPRSPPASEDLAELAGRHASWPRNEIDAFTLAKMAEHGLAPSPEADRRTLARRVALDLIGVPPTWEEVEAFVRDGEPDAYERYVRRLLASPRYGERWARMWLDLARFADSTGYGQDTLRPFLWRWRDWVIDAFNRNQRYDDFTIEQLAGDLLPDPTPDQLLATAFHRNTMTNVEGGTVDEEFRVAAVKDRIDTTMQVWMGLTLGCAKCHSHKFDPIPHKDYYRFFAVFNQTEDADRADEEPRLATPTAVQAAKRVELESKLAAVAQRRDEVAADLSGGQARWEKEAAANEKEWIALVPRSARSKEGAELAVSLDGTVRVRGATPATDEYVLDVDAPASASPITAFRLEALPERELPGGGPGRSQGNGNFVLNEFGVEVLPRDSAPATAPPRARTIRIELPGPRRILSLAEVEAFVGGTNVARQAVATQSSVDFDGPPELAIDGVADGDYRKARSTTHTREGPDPWWELDLGGELAIERIVVWNRTDDGLQARLKGARLSLLDERRATVWQTVLVETPDPSLELRPGGPSIVAFARARAGFEQDRFSAAQAIDLDESAPSGWAIAPQQGGRHIAIFELAAPLAVRGQGPATLRFELAQTWGVQHTLGRFRLSAWCGPRPPIALPGDVAAAIAKPSSARSAADAKLVAAHYRSIAPELELYREAMAPLEAELAVLETSIVRTPILRELPVEKRRKTHVMLKSNYQALGDEVHPSVPAAFHPLPDGVAADRLAIARWLVAPENPLTARVTVNRFWAQLFGRGIVETEEDFGTQGTPPTHPELLDWLALRFVESGWDVKELLFTIVTSATYRQSSAVDEATLAVDPRAVWLERYPRRRLDAETVRDQALAVAGLLSSKLHGPSVFPPQPDGLWQVAFNGETNYPTSSGEDRWRRGLYTFWRRTVPPPSMQTFDAPSREYCAIRRQATNTPLQALVTLNDPCFVEAAQALANGILFECIRAVQETGDSRHASPAARATLAFRRALLRDPTSEELAVLLELHEVERARLASEPAESRPAGELPDVAIWTTIASVVLNLDAVLTKN